MQHTFHKCEVWSQINIGTNEDLAMWDRSDSGELDEQAEEVEQPSDLNWVALGADELPVRSVAPTSRTVDFSENPFKSSLGVLKPVSEKDQKEKPKADVSEKTETSEKPTEVDQIARELDFDVRIQLDRSPEAVFTRWSQNALRRDADIKGFEPRETRDEKGRLVSTTYTLREVGLTERPLPPNKSEDVKPFARTVEITVPVGATHLKDCKFDFKDREEITKDSFISEVRKMQERHEKLSGSKSVCTYTHGIITSADASDVQALALEITSGHPVISMDWNAHRKPLSFDGASPYNVEIMKEKNDLYKIDTAIAAKSESKFHPWFGEIEKTVGAKNTEIIGFSHGADVNQGALAPQKGEKPTERVHHYIEVHPDLKETKIGEATYSRLAGTTYVLGNQQDRALKAAAGISEPARMGRDTPVIRKKIEDAGGIPITDPPRKDGKEQVHNEHYINYAAVAELLNSDQTWFGIHRSPAEMQLKVTAVSDAARPPAKKASKK